VDVNLDTALYEADRIRLRLKRRAGFFFCGLTEQMTAPPSFRFGVSIGLFMTSAAFSMTAPAA
jgi:hypothetical protein